MAETTLHRARHVLPIERAPITDGAVAVTGDTIAWVGAYTKRPRAYRDLPAKSQLDHGEAALLPGFVNPHSHVILHQQRGIADGEGFIDWLNGAIVKLDLTDPTRNRLACLDGFREGLACGITTWGDNHYRLEPFYAAQELGIRATLFIEIFGIRGDVEHQRESLERRLAEARAHATPEVQAGISPHTIYTVPPPLLNFCANLAKREDALLSIHLGETREEREFLTSPNGRLRRMLGKQSLTLIPPVDRTLTRYLADHGCLSERSLIIHGVHLDKTELKDLAKAKASLVHCPVSNSRLRCGIAPVEDALKAGVRLAIGTDSVASGERHDPFLAMSLAIAFQEALHPDPGATTAVALLRAATLGGAVALHREREVGSLAVGKKADLVVLRLPEESAHPNRGIEARIVYSGERSWVKGVWVGGKKRV